MNGKLYFLAQPLIQPAKERPAAGNVNPPAVNVGSQLGRSGFQRFKDRLFNFENALIQCFRHFLVAYHNLFGYACYQVASVNRKIIGRIIEVFHGGSYLDLDLLCRALADDLGVSRATVVTAYDQLASEGYVEGRHGAGMFVSSALPEQVLQVSTATPHRPATPKRTTTRAQNPIRPFQVGAIDPELFPFREWSRLLQRTWRSPRKELLAHQSPFGWPELRQAIARHLLEWRGIACDDSRIVITSGTTDAIELITHLAFYAGWPNAMSALTAARKVFDKPSPK